MTRPVIGCKHRRERDLEADLLQQAVQVEQGVRVKLPVFASGDEWFVARLRKNAVTVAEMLMDSNCW